MRGAAGPGSGRAPAPRDSRHNVLVVGSTSLPVGALERRRLGLPRLPAALSGGRRAAAAGRESHHFVRLEGLGRPAASHLSRLIRAAGGTASGGSGAGASLLLGGDDAAFALAIGRAARHEAVRRAALEIDAALSGRRDPPRDLGLRSGRLALDAGPLVMGILNVTPDSFSDGGRFLGRRQAVAQALRMAEEGAAIIDIGGESTRPGATPVPLFEELRRVMPVLEAVVAALARLKGRRPLVSIDTVKAEVARRAAAAGADLINDISGLSFDPAMPAAAAESGLSVVISHIRKTPRTMGRPSRYARLIPEIAASLRRQIALALAAGVRHEKIVIDPGIGFGKGRRDNLAILRHLPALRSLGHPILIGASRKSFIGGTLELPIVERLEGSLAAEALAIAGGADIIRAHDVRAAARVAVLCAAVHGVRPTRSG